jgi:hypothetical protein
MTKFYFVICICAIFQLNFAQNKLKPDLEVYQLQGTVKSLRFTTGEAIDRFGVVSFGKIYKDELREYNKNGFNTTNTTFNANGSVEFKFAKKHNSKNQFIENITYDNEGKCFDTFKRQYDEANKLISTKSYGCDGIFSGAFLYEYDSNGNNIIRTQIMNDYDEYFMSFQYDKKNNQTEERYYIKNPDNSANKLLFEDKIGFYSPTKYEYSDLGELKKKTAFNALGDIISISIFIDEENFIEERYKEGKKIGEIENKSFITKRDKNKNWTEKIIYENGIAKRMIKRFIEYF